MILKRTIGIAAILLFLLYSLLLYIFHNDAVQPGILKYLWQFSIGFFAYEFRNSFDNKGRGKEFFQFFNLIIN